MPGIIDKGTWIEIRQVVLPAGERAPQVPADTLEVPLEMRVKGYLLAPAALGDVAEILTQTGRKLSGIITDINPAYTHGFGAPIVELSRIGPEARALLRAWRRGA